MPPFPQAFRQDRITIRIRRAAQIEAGSPVFALCAFCLFRVFLSSARGQVARLRIQRLQQAVQGSRGRGEQPHVRSSNVVGLNLLQDLAVDRPRFVRLVSGCAAKDMANSRVTKNAHGSL